MKKVIRKAYIEVATDLSEQEFEDWLKKAIYLNEETKNTNKYNIQDFLSGHNNP
jgi:beta-lactamase class D